MMMMVRHYERVGKLSPPTTRDRINYKRNISCRCFYCEEQLRRAKERCKSVVK